MCNKNVINVHIKENPVPIKSTRNTPPTFFRFNSEGTLDVACYLRKNIFLPLFI